MVNKQIVLDKLNREELHRYLGYKANAITENTLDDTVRSIIDKCEEKLMEVVKPAYVWNVFDIREAYENSVYKGIEFIGTDLILDGESIRKHLAGCHKAILLCATLSGEADKLIRQAEIRDMAEALVVDTEASVAIEQVCNKAELYMKECFEDMYMTYRFGVGYGDLSLMHEHMILNILNTGKLIGLYSTEANILTPRKSVVCVVGLSEQPLPKGRRGCATCSMIDRCSYRKQGLSCS